MEEEVDIVTKQLKGKLRVTVAKEVWKAFNGAIKWAIILKPATTKSFKMSECISTLSKTKSSLALVSFEELAHNLLLAKFNKKEDMNSVLEAGPWSFLGDIVLCETWKQGLDLKQLQFNKAEVWLQIHNLPIEMVRSEMAKEFASYAGLVLKEFHSKSSINKRKYARFRIEVDLNKALCTGFFLDLEEGDSIWIDFKYERLHYCLKCGDFTHESTRCKDQESFDSNQPRNPITAQSSNQSTPKDSMAIEAILEENQATTKAAKPLGPRSVEEERTNVPIGLEIPAALTTINSPIIGGTENKETDDLTEVVIVQMDSGAIGKNFGNLLRHIKVDAAIPNTGLGHATGPLTQLKHEAQVSIIDSASPENQISKKGKAKASQPRRRPSSDQLTSNK